MIYSKLDWYTAIVDDFTLVEILEKLGFNADLYTDFLEQGYETSSGYFSNFTFAANGITLNIRYDDYVANSDHLFDHKFFGVRVDISGSGLDYLRSLIPDIDFQLRKQNFWTDDLSKAHVTRCDIAFDFVNFKSDFLQHLIDFLIDTDKYYCSQNMPSRLRLGGNSAVKFSIRNGDQRTVYLGTAHSDRLLRIYDKKLQYCEGGIWKKEAPQQYIDEEGEIESWFRIEIQCRRDCASEILFASDSEDYKEVLRFIFNKYRFVDYRTGKVWDEWRDFTDWDSLPKLNKIKTFSQVKSIITKAEEYITGIAFKNLITYISIYGVESLITTLNNHLHHLYTGTSRSAVLGAQSLRIRLAQLCDQQKINGQQLLDLGHTETYRNNFYLKGFKAFKEEENRIPFMRDEYSPSSEQEGGEMI